MGQVASPPGHDLVIDRNQDITHWISLPAGDYLAGGSAAWTLVYTLRHPDGTLILTKTTGAGVVVDTPGSESEDAWFTIAFADTEIDDEVEVNVHYDFLFRRVDAGAEINIDAGRIRFKR